MKNHRDLLVWKLARENALAIYRHTAKYWTPNRRSVLDQLQRSALSIHLNISEGSAFGPGARCRFHLRIAHGSAVETAELLSFLIDLGADVGQLLEVANRVSAMTYGLWRMSPKTPTRT